MTGLLERHRRKLVPIVVAALAVVAAVVFRAQLIAWFTGKPIGDRSGAPANTKLGQLVVTAALDPDPTPQRGALVLDLTDAAGRPVEGATVSAQYVMPAMGAMQEMRGSATVEPHGSRYRLGFDLPMAGTWTLDASITSPKGTGTVEYRFTTGVSGLAAQAEAGGGDVAYYTCPMHTSVRSNTPGACPMCSMPLQPVTTAHVASGTVTIPQEQRDAFGIRTAPVVTAAMKRTTRAVGRVTYDETRLTDVSLKLDGWIAHLDVDATGQQVKKGQRLLTLYSPDLYAAQQEYLIALASASTAGLADAAKQKLERWGLTAGQVADLARRGAPLENVPILAPASGTVIEKNVVEGASVQAGERLFRLAALDEVWVEAEVYEQDLSLVKPGQPATITLSYLPGAAIAGQVAFVYPYLDPTTRTGHVRIAIPNKDRSLKPDMYANVELAFDLGDRLQIPSSAVVYTGTRRVVFVDLDGDRLRPVEVQLGARTDDMVEVISGLSAGASVLVSGNFLVAAESRIRSAAFWGADDGK